MLKANTSIDDLFKELVFSDLISTQEFLGKLVLIGYEVSKNTLKVSRERRNRGGEKVMEGRKTNTSLFHADGCAVTKDCI